MPRSTLRYWLARKGKLDADWSWRPCATPTWVVDGPLTETRLTRIPEAARTIVVDDFTRVFLDLPRLAALRRERALAVRCPVEFGGFVVTLRDLSRSRFLTALADDALARWIAFNPYEVGAAGEGRRAAA